MIIEVHAMDWSVSQCSPIAQQRAKIVTMRPMQRSTQKRSEPLLLRQFSFDE
jgi:hypothetical protein